jgi:predicted nucleic acid-binding protein
MNGLTLDTGALVALERRDRRAGVLVQSARDHGARVTVPSVAIVEWWHGQRGVVARLLDAFDIEPLDRDLAKVAGVARALARSGPSAVDAVVMASAAKRGDVVVTGDIEDLERLRVAAFPTVRLLRV